jgi:alpha-mannosidase
VPVISWLAAEAAGSGLAVLLDGPQGASATPERLGVSLLRAPTWPDPGADNGPQRLRLALMPCAEGWRQAGAAEQAVRFREPPWLRPLGPGGAEVFQAGSGLAGEGPLQPSPGPTLDLGAPHLRLIGLRCLPFQGGKQVLAAALPADSAELALTVQNLSPLRQRLDLGPNWQLLGRIDGLDQPLPQAPEVLDRLAEMAVVRPWQLASYRIRRRA